MASAALQPLGGWRNEACVIPITVVGLDLTGIAMRAQVRLAPDTPGAALIDLATVTTTAEGLKLGAVTTAGGVPTSNLTLRINKSTMQGLPYAGELGDATMLAYALQLGGVTRLYGPFAVLASAIDSDAAPTSRPVGTGGTGALVSAVALTVGDGGVTVRIEAMDQFAPLIAQAKDAATAAQASATALTAGVAALLGEARTRGTVAPATGATVNSVIIASPDLVRERSMIDQVTVKANAAGTGYAVLSDCLPANPSYQIVRTFVPIAWGAGTTDIAVPPTILERGGTVNVRTATGAGPFYDLNGSSLVKTGADSVNGVGASFAFEMDYLPIACAIAYRARALPQAQPNRSAIVGPVLRSRLRFVSAPLAGWLVGANGTVSNGFSASGATFSGANCAELASYSSAADQTLEAEFTVVDASGQCSLATQPQNNGRGCALIVDGALNTMRLWHMDSATNLSGATAPVAVPALIIGRRYLLQVVYGKLKTVAVWRDLRTGAITTLTDDFATAPHVRNWHGAPFVCVTKGNVCNEARFYTNRPGIVRTVILHDSIGEGVTAASTAPSWCHMLADIPGAAVVLSGRAGDVIQDALWNVWSDLVLFRPENVVIQLGCNETSQATWRSKMSVLVGLARSLGTRVTMCTYSPRPDNQAFLTAANGDILGGYFGAEVGVIDIAAALSLNNDRVTANPAFYYSDGIHILSNPGAMAAKAQALAQAPFAFEGPPLA